MNDLVSAGLVERRICLLRGERVMLDAHLAALYGVTTGNLNKAVDRNLERFPRDFMFRLDLEERRNLRFQSGSLRWGEHSKYPPRAFTELGVAKLRRLLAEHKELAALVAKHEQRLDGHDLDIAELIETVPQLPPPEPESKPIAGFTPPPKGKRKRPLPTS